LRPAQGALLNILRVSHLSKTYRKGKVDIPALRDVSLDVAAGEFVSLVGRSGSGKSTLLNLIGGLDTATSGRIFFRGRDLTTMKRPELARHRRLSVGMVFQSFNLIVHRSALDNVALALLFGGAKRGVRREKAVRLLASVGLGHRLNHKPGELSGGEAQRVAIARALANNPQALLLDEPTGNLDTATSLEIMNLIRKLNKERGITVLMVTHEQDVAATFSTKIVHLSDGRVVDHAGPGGVV
jgi:ABC-type lipoprotein export system ATPase subunit